MHDFLFRIFERNAKNLLIKKCEKTEPATKDLILNEDERYHYGDIEIVDKGFLSMSSKVLPSTGLNSSKKIPELKSRIL